MYRYPKVKGGVHIVNTFIIRRAYIDQFPLTLTHNYENKD